MADFLDKATSTLNEAKESVTTTAETTMTSLTDAQKTVAASAETVKSEATAAGETVKTEVAAAPEKVQAANTQARDVVDSALSRGIEGAKNLLHTFEEKRTEVSSQIVGAVTNVVGGASSSTNRDLPVSTDNQPLLSGQRGVETTPWWKNCCGVLDLLKESTTKKEQEKK